MPAMPMLSTPRLWLRAFEQADAPAVQRLAGDRRIADTTLLIPHPYPEGAAEAWIATHEAAWILGRGLTLAIVLRATDACIGAIGLGIDPDTRSGTLGYWIGVPFWNQGYCTEAARAMIAFAFRRLRLRQVQANHFARNPASGRVMHKAGMHPDGLRRAAVVKDGRTEDLQDYVIRREEWKLDRAAP